MVLKLLISELHTVCKNMTLRCNEQDYMTAELLAVICSSAMTSK